MSSFTILNGRLDGFFGWMLRWYRSHRRVSIVIGHFEIRFSSSGIAGTFVGHPIDTIKVRQQTYPHGLLTTRRCVQLALKNEGVS